MSGGSSIARRVRRATLFVSLVLLAPGCSRSVGTWLGPNEPPQIEIVDARGGRGVGVRVRWAARDPDGRVVQSRWRLDPWNARPSPDGADPGIHATTTEECLLPAPELPALRASSAVREPQRFSLWAIDDRGARSEPATLAIFAPGNIAPIVAITSPVPSSLLRAQVGSDLCITWVGQDPDGLPTQKPVKYKFRLLDLDDPNNQVYLANPDSLRRLAVATNWAGWDSTSADTEFVHYTNLVPTKSYLFTVTGWDQAGDYDPIFNLNKNMLQFSVGFPQTLGPLMTVTGSSFRYQYASSGGFDDPSRVIHSEVAAGEPVPFDWTSRPIVGQTITGYRWVLDPVDPRDDTPRSGPDDVRHWSAWTLTPTVELGPFAPLGHKRAEHTLYLEARSSAGACAAGGTEFVSAAPVHFVVVAPSFGKDLLVVDDTRLEVDKFTGACPGNYTQRWPSAAELDTFLYARGGVTWRCTKNPTSGVLSIPGILAGYSFDTTGTRGVLSGRQTPANSQTQVIPLSVLANYRHVLWLTDGASALINNPPESGTLGMTAMRFLSQPGAVNVLNTYLHMGGKLWLAGGGTATAALLPYDKLSNNTGGVTRFTSLGPFNELFPPNLVWDGPHLRSEVSVTNGIQAARALGRLEPSPGPYGTLPPTLDPRTSTSDPLPPTRTIPSQFYFSTRPVEFLSQPNSILEAGVSVLDSLYVVSGASVPIGTANVAMTVYHGSETGECVWTGFDLWNFQRGQCIQLVDGVLQGIWGLSRDPVARATAGGAAVTGGPAHANTPPPLPASAKRALRVRY